MIFSYCVFHVFFSLIAFIPIGVFAGQADQINNNQINKELSKNMYLLSQSSPRMKAINLARMRAEKINGGLARYRAASCMFTSTGEDCLVSDTSKGFLIRFLGGEPGWEQLGIPPTVETEVLVSPDASNIVDVTYNGPLRF